MTSFDSGWQPMLSLRDVCERLSVSESTARRMIRRGELEAQRVGGQYRFDPTLVDAMAGKPQARPAVNEGPDSVPDWASERVGTWRTGVANLLGDSNRAQVIVLDRRGAKAFSMVRPPGFTWGRNLWHSSILKTLPPTQIKKLFESKSIFVFDEMVQRGRDLRRTRDHLEDLGLQVNTVCLVRRRAAFDDGTLVDFEVQPVEDLSSSEFSKASSFLSHLFDYSEPPLDPEHILVHARSESGLSIEDVFEALGELGSVETVWNRQAQEDAAVAAVTLDRPTFFDTANLNGMHGLTADWDGPCKIRAYLSDGGKRVTFAFITFPTLSGSHSDWQTVVGEVNDSYGLEAEERLSNERAELAYVDVCTSLSVELMRQAVSASLFSRLGLVEIDLPPVNELAAFFGRRRATTLKTSLQNAIEGDAQLVIDPKKQAVDRYLDHDRRFCTDLPTERVHEMIVQLLPHRQSEDGKSAGEPLSYGELIRATRPVNEESVSSALDGLLDGVRAKPRDVVLQTDFGMRAFRAFVGSEYGKDDPYDARDVRRTAAIAVGGFDLWLKLNDAQSSTEIHVAKLFANLVHDWDAHFKPLTIKNVPYKHGMIPALQSTVPYGSDRPTYLLYELERVGFFIHDVGDGTKRRNHYAISDDVDVAGFLKTADVKGSERTHLRGLVRAYAAIQSECRVTRPKGPGSTETRRRSDPLVMLSSVRNEKTAYECALFEIEDWIRNGRQLFRSLHGMWALSDNVTVSRRVREDSVPFAQAARFLYEKVAMYDALADLRAQMVELFDEEGLDAGEIILETVDEEPRFAMDYATTEWPVGLLRWGLDVVRPFSSMVRQVLTGIGLEQDRRPEASRTLAVESGEEVVKDARYYAGQLSDAAADDVISAEAISIARILERPARSSEDDQALIERLGQLFERIVSLLTTRIKSSDQIAEELQRQQKAEKDLLGSARWFDEKTQGSGSMFVAVGDVYNFVNIVAAHAARNSSTGVDAACQLQEALRDAVNETVQHFETAIGCVSGDSCVLAAETTGELFSLVQQTDRAIKRAALEWYEEDVPASQMRFGLAALRTVGDGWHDVISAYRLSERHGQPPGTLTVSSEVYANLDERDRALFSQVDGHDPDIYAMNLE